MNGPEDDLGWDSVDWGQAEENVRRLRQRIFAASQAGDPKRVRSLQKLMLRSRSNALVSVRRVTEVNAGRRTAGVDGRIVLTSWEKADLAAWLQRGAAGWRPRPVRRVYGWAAYYRIGVSKRAYNALDAHLWRLAWKWANFSHPNKPRRWIITRHFGMFNPARQDKWVFGSRDTGFYLRKFAWTKIVRHKMVVGRASPDDPALTGYWQQRRRRERLPVDPATWHLLRRQRGRCPLCRGLLLHADRQPQSPEEWQQWHTVTRKAIRKHAIDSVTDPGTPDERVAHHLIHAHCRNRIGNGTSPALLPGLQPQGLA